MSKSVAVLSAGAKPALLQRVVNLVRKATNDQLVLREVSAVEANSVVLGPDAPAGVYASATLSPTPNPSAAYAGVATTVVRAILPRTDRDTLQLRDKLDVYPDAGIACDAELTQARDGFTRAAAVAIEAAKSRQATRITLVIKPASKYKQLNDCFVRAASAAIEAAGMSTDVLHTAQAANELLLFPERHAVVLTNDEPICENIQLAYAGVTGGTPLVYYSEQHGTLYGGHSYTSIALALAEQLRALGLTKEASSLVYEVRRK